MSIAKAAMIIIVGFMMSGFAQTGEKGTKSHDAPRLGKPVSPSDAATLELTVFPDGTGLPPGRGKAVDGRSIFTLRCASCHGEAGKGATAEELSGRSGSLSSEEPDKTVGQYWPYATTLFDFIRRSMPLDAPGSLSADEVYALTAYLLQVNEVISENEEMNAITLPRVVMPNRYGFIAIDVQQR